ncbi:MAG: hypothetical protein LBG58_01265 [Planctomycetaceae bacterium]|nr:hypothetical protein [Planctomycetaceae bacterium]
MWRVDSGECCKRITIRVQLSMIYCSFRALIVLTITRRVAAGWLVLPFQGERISVTIDRHPQTENAPPKKSR